MSLLLQNKLLVQRAASIWDTKDFALLKTVYDENCIHHQQSKHRNITFQGINRWQQQMEDFLNSYPDYREEIISQIAEDNKVVSILECYGKDIAWYGITIDLVENGKILESWAWFKRQ